MNWEYDNRGKMFRIEVNGYELRVIPTILTDNFHWSVFKPKRYTPSKAGKTSNLRAAQQAAIQAYEAMIATVPPPSAGSASGEERGE